MKTNLTRRITVAALALLLLCGTAFAAGTIRTQMIEANYMDIQLVVNGLKVTPTDASGNALEPFASNGTTYLPVRAVAGALGENVHWDGATNTVYIGDNIPGVDANWMTKVPAYNLIHATAYTGTDQESFFEAGGRKQTQGVVMECGGCYDRSKEIAKNQWVYELTEGAFTYSAAASWNTDGQYQTMHFSAEHLLGEDALNCKLEVWLDGVCAKTVELPYDAPTKAVDVDLNGAAGVTLKLITQQEAHSQRMISRSQYAIYNISFE